MNLSKKHCLPCKTGTPPLAGKKIKEYQKEILDWKVIRQKKLLKEFKLKNFRQVMDFVKKIASLAEREGHHPDIHIFYNRVRLQIWTHAIGGLSVNDFILATKVDKISLKQ